MLPPQLCAAEPCASTAIHQLCPASPPAFSQFRPQSHRSASHLSPHQFRLLPQLFSTGPPTDTLLPALSPTQLSLDPPSPPKLLLPQLFPTSPPQILLPELRLPSFPTPRPPPPPSADLCPPAFPQLRPPPAPPQLLLTALPNPSCSPSPCFLTVLPQLHPLALFQASHPATPPLALPSPKPPPPDLPSPAPSSPHSHPPAFCPSPPFFPRVSRGQSSPGHLGSLSVR
ncbi:protein EOLA1 isoform X1 [Phyllostomus discolor]|uniref:Protein EOLA1 isoform X1 n=1 Tax=Phyllostomus discolor TaxID=89673 RepID=A0A7E6D014_9CHIR|nr:protein EOLA1 isoform X1 [Phyllostomus discolor]